MTGKKSKFAMPIPSDDEGAAGHTAEVETPQVEAPAGKPDAAPGADDRITLASQGFSVFEAFAAGAAMKRGSGANKPGPTASGLIEHTTVRRRKQTGGKEVNEPPSASPSASSETHSLPGGFQQDGLGEEAQRAKAEAAKLEEERLRYGEALRQELMRKRDELIANLERERKRHEELAKEEEARKLKADLEAATKAMTDAAAHARRAADDLQRRNASAKINRGWLEHGVVEDGVRGSRIHLDFNIVGMHGTEGGVAAFLQYADGESVKDKNGKFKSSDNGVAVVRTMRPGFPSAHYGDFALFIPYEEFHLSVRRVDLRWRVAVRALVSEGRNLADITLPFTWSEG